MQASLVSKLERVNKWRKADVCGAVGVFLRGLLQSSKERLDLDFASGDLLQDFGSSTSNVVWDGRCCSGFKLQWLIRVWTIEITNLHLSGLNRQFDISGRRLKDSSDGQDHSSLDVEVDVVKITVDPSRGLVEHGDSVGTKLG